MGKSTLSMAIFNSKLLVYQRVSLFIMVYMVIYNEIYFRYSRISG